MAFLSSANGKQCCQCIWFPVSCVVLEFNLLVSEVFVLENEIDLSCCCWSLQLLSIQHLFLQLLNGLSKRRSMAHFRSSQKRWRICFKNDIHTHKKKNLSHLPCLRKSFGYFAVAAAVAGCDEVSHAAALQEGCAGHGPGGAENAGKGNHLHQAQPDHCCLSVVPKAQTVTETCPDRNNVLKDRRKRGSKSWKLWTRHRLPGGEQCSNKYERSGTDGGTLQKFYNFFQNKQKQNYLTSTHQ